MAYDTRKWVAGTARAKHAGRWIDRAVVYAVNADDSATVVAELPGDRWVTDLIARQIVAEHTAARGAS